KAYEGSVSILGPENAIAANESLVRTRSVLGNVLDRFGVSEKDKSEAYDILRSGELLSRIMDPKTHQVSVEALNRFTDTISKLVIATEGKVPPAMFLGTVKQGNLAMQNFTDEGLLASGILAQGLGGPKAGTAMMSLFRQFAGGKMTKSTAEA